MSNEMQLGFNAPVQDCHLWAGAKNKEGYGILYFQGKQWRAHRLSYRTYYGEFDENFLVCHKCDNPSCINPFHLFLGTQKDNMQDKISKGRGANFKGENGGQSKLSWRSVKLIRMFLARKIPSIEIVKAYGISKAQVSRIKNNTRWVA